MGGDAGIGQRVADAPMQAGAPTLAIVYYRISTLKYLSCHPTPSTPISALEMYDWCGHVEARGQLREGSHYGCSECECGKDRKKEALTRVG